MQQEKTELIYESPLRVVKSDEIKNEEISLASVKPLMEPKLNMPVERQRYIKPKLHDPL